MTKHCEACGADMRNKWVGAENRGRVLCLACNHIGWALNAHGVRCLDTYWNYVRNLWGEEHDDEHNTPAHTCQMPKCVTLRMEEERRAKVLAGQT